jgi:signal transduction histidine kinase
MGGLWQNAARSARARILAAMLLVATIGMAAAGVSAYLIQRERVLAQIDARLTATVDGLQCIADGCDGTAPSDTMLGFLNEAMKRVLPDHNESTLGIIDGMPRLRPSSGISFRLDDDPDFVARVVEEADADAVVRGTAATQFGSLRYVIIPVTIGSDDERGLYVSAYDLDAELSEISEAFRTYWIVAGGALVLVGLAGWFVSGRILRPLRLLRATASQVGERGLTQRIPVTGTDDVSELSRAFNAMLERLQHSFDTQRRLLDDVSHELRTPITIVRGHLELLDPDDPAEVTATRELAIDELDRMNVLVDDIALLVKTSTPGFLARERVDVAEFTEQVLAKARALGPDHEWRLGGAAHVVVALDAARITQAWLQLAENAAKYAPPGTPIELASAIVPRDGAETLELSVRDSGPGIPAEKLDWVFDRFSRVEVGRGVAGSGLGLSIVAAIAAGHGGRAYAEKPSGPGARVVIALPIDTEEEPDAAHPDR